MGRAAALALLAADPVQARAFGARGRGEHLVAVLVERHIVEGNHVVRPLAGLRELELADLGLDVPRVVVAPLDPRIAEPERPRPRQPAELDRMPRAEDQVVEPVGPALEAVLEVVGDLDDRVARPHLADLLVLPEKARAAEDEGDLLREPM